MRSWAYSILVALALLSGAGGATAQQTCTSDSLRKAVDDTGAALRRLTTDSQPKLQAGFRRLKEKRGWSEEEHLDKASELLADAKTEEFDTKAGQLLARMDRLAEDPAPNCSKLGELEATSLELQATVRAKTQHMLARLDAVVTDAPGPAPGPAPKPVVKDAVPKEAPKTSPASPPPAKSASTERPPVPPAPATPKATEPKPPATSWSTSTVEETRARQEQQAAQSLPPVASAPLPAPIPRVDGGDGFSRDEIREASRGLFGTVSAGFASVIEHAFSQFGRPTAYVLGNEGGGAFLAGVRYGKGTLFTRSRGSREVHWHGPSIGYDFGASGSKTLFLVYGLQNDLDIFAGFSGVDGSAYLVGGVGMTVLTNGSLVLAPIRSGVGLRLGASIGYIRFTPRATWNPF